MLPGPNIQNRYPFDNRSDNSNRLKDQWKLTEHLVSYHGGHHIASYDRFLEQRLPELVVRCFDLRGDDRADHKGGGKSTFYIRCSNVQVKRPTVINEGRPLYPQECRLRRLSYVAPVEADFEWRFGPDEAPQRKNIKLCDIPILLKCSRCHLSPENEKYSKEYCALNGEDFYDSGGYFIVNGTEKVLLALEQATFNKIIIRTERDEQSHLIQTVSAEVISNGVERKTKAIVTLKEKRFYLQTSQFKSGVNVGAVFKAMGLVSDQLIVKLIGGGERSQEYLQLTLLECKELGVRTQREAFGYLAGLLGQKETRGQVRTAVQDVLDWLVNSLFCHIPVPAVYKAPPSGVTGASNTQNTVHSTTKDKLNKKKTIPVEITHLTRYTNTFYNFHAKQYFLAQIVQKIIQAHATNSNGSDRDYFGNKSILLAGDTMALVFEEACKDLARVLSKKLTTMITSKRESSQLSSLVSLLGSNAITSNVLKPLSCGTIQLERLKYTFPGCVQVLSRFCTAGAAGHVTKLTSTFDKTLKATGPRMLANSQVGICCLSDTPEGESVGIIKAFATLARVSLAWPDDSETAPQKVPPMLHALGVVPNGIFDIRPSNVNSIHLSGAIISPNTLEENNSELMKEQNAQIQENKESSQQCGYKLTTAAVSVDGYRIGTHCDAQHLMQQIRDLRRAGVFGHFVSVYWDNEDQTVCIACSSGRPCRPFIVVDYKNGKSVPRLTNRDVSKVEKGLLSVEDLLQLGKIEYLDVNEQSCSRIAFSAVDLEFGSYTHLEIDTAAYYGIVASLVPFPHHNQSPRNAFQCAMGKQVLGAPFLNIQSRFDSAGYQLVYPQAPLVSSRLSRRCTQLLSLPAGGNAILAVQSAGGDDIEDALVFNRAATDRGYGRAIVFKSHDIDLDRQTLAGQPCELREALRSPHYRPQSDSAFEHFAPAGHSDTYNQSGVYNKNPYKTRLQDKLRRFHAIGPDGVSEVGAKVEDGDVIVVKTRVQNSANQNNLGETQITQEDVTDVQIKMPIGEQGIVDAVALVDGKQKMVRVRVREVRPPFYGDKFSSRHGQKGTVGLIARATDLPFCMSTGIIPDQIMNPHGFPSRMTVGKLLELLSGKEAVLKGSFAEGGLFCAARVTEVCQGLLDNGFNYFGRDLLISGITGLPQRCYVFQGPVFYQRLKHMVSDKMHARATGPKKFDTRQPTEGRAQDGGLRLGEMEKDCFVAYGTAAALHERMVTSSDGFDAAVCQKCGFIGAFMSINGVNNQNIHENQSGIKTNLQLPCEVETETGMGVSAGYCQHCRGGSVARVTLPYAAKLLAQELLAMGLVMRLKLD